jgi:hypothetical protein
LPRGRRRGLTALLGLGAFGGQAGQAGQQRPRRLHGLDARELGAARGGGVAGGVGIEGLALGLGDGLLEGCEVAEPPRRASSAAFWRASSAWAVARAAASATRAWRSSAASGAWSASCSWRRARASCSAFMRW